MLLNIWSHGPIHNPSSFREAVRHPLKPKGEKRMLTLATTVIALGLIVIAIRRRQARIRQQRAIQAELLRALAADLAKACGTLDTERNVDRDRLLGLLTRVPGIEAGYLYLTVLTKDPNLDFLDDGERLPSTEDTAEYIGAVCRYAQEHPELLATS